MYAIVTDGDGSWWIQGDEGRVNEELFVNKGAAKRAALVLLNNGKEVDTESYYVDDDDGDGPDWDNPRPLA